MKSFFLIYSIKKVKKAWRPQEKFVCELQITQEFTPSHQTPKKFPCLWLIWYALILLLWLQNHNFHLWKEFLKPHFNWPIYTSKPQEIFLQNIDSPWFDSGFLFGVKNQRYCQIKSFPKRYSLPGVLVTNTPTPDIFFSHVLTRVK